MKFFLFLLIVVSINSPFAAQASAPEKGCRDSGNRSANSYHFKRDKKAFAGSNDPKELPPNVLEKIYGQLRDGIGEATVQRLRFQHIRALDFDSSRSLLFNDLKRVDAYELHFEAQIDGTSGRAYVFSVGTDRNGRFLSDPDLPDITSDPAKGRILPCQEAIEAAYKTGYLVGVGDIYAEIEFEPTDRVFSWNIYGYKKGVAKGLVSLHVLLNANSGATIRTSERYHPF